MLFTVAANLRVLYVHSDYVISEEDISHILHSFEEDM